MESQQQIDDNARQAGNRWSQMHVSDNRYSCSAFRLMFPWQQPSRVLQEVNVVCLVRTSHLFRRWPAQPEEMPNSSSDSKRVHWTETADVLNVWKMYWIQILYQHLFVSLSLSLFSLSGNIDNISDHLTLTFPEEEVHQGMSMIAWTVSTANVIS